MQPVQDLKLLYEKDFIGWCNATAAYLKAGKLEQLDTENLIEEIESLGRRDGL